MFQIVRQFFYFFGNAKKSTALLEHFYWNDLEIRNRHVIRNKFYLWRLIIKTYYVSRNKILFYL